MILVHSSLKGTGIDPDKFIDELIETYGTVLFPTFNWGFEKHGFNIRNTPSNMGILTNIALKRAKVRTGHPMYSFAVLGEEAHRFEGEDNYSALAYDSPFGILTRMDGEIMVVNLTDNHSMTYYHHVEEVLGVPYKKLKEVSGSYVDKYGIETRRTYAISIRKPGVIRVADPMAKILEEKGLWKHEGKYKRVIKARECFDAIAEVINEGRAEGLLWKKG